LGAIYVGKKKTFEKITKSRFNPEECDRKLSQHSTISFAHEWTIEKIADLCSEQVSGFPRIESAAFSPPNHPEYEFTLWLLPKGNGDDYADYISPILHLASSPTDPLLVLFKFSIIDADNQKCNTQGGKLRLY